MEGIEMKGNSLQGRTKRPLRQVLPAPLQRVNLNAAGIEIGARRHYVAVPESRDEVSVRDFGTFTTDLNRLADWLAHCGVETVVMESTGVYWIPAYELLEARGFEVKLVNARHVKTVPGRKSDVLDCQWLQQLHTFGLLAGAFRPPEQVCVLRAYLASAPRWCAMPPRIFSTCKRRSTR
jgi:transposase